MFLLTKLLLPYLDVDTAAALLETCKANYSAFEKTYPPIAQCNNRGLAKRLGMAKLLPWAECDGWRFQIAAGIPDPESHLLWKRDWMGGVVRNQSWKPDTTFLQNNVPNVLKILKDKYPTVGATLQRYLDVHLWQTVDGHLINAHRDYCGRGEPYIVLVPIHECMWEARFVIPDQDPNRICCFQCVQLIFGLPYTESLEQK